jgi:hypothetical protein
MGRALRGIPIVLKAPFQPSVMYQSNVKIAESSAKTVELLEQAAVERKRSTDTAAALELEFRCATDPVFRQWREEKRSAEAETAQKSAAAKRERDQLARRLELERLARKRVEDRRNINMFVWFWLCPLIFCVLGLLLLGQSAERLASKLRSESVQSSFFERRVRVVQRKLGSPYRFADTFS